MSLSGAVRALAFRKRHRELLGLEIVEKYIADASDGDVLFHVSHRHYLSTTFNQRERVEAALFHYRYEGEHYDACYKDAVYRDGGIVLWSREVGGFTYALKLRATTDLRHEGGISVVLCAGNVVLNEMSYAWMPAGLLGMGRGTVPFITRNQGVHRSAPELALFRGAFPQNSPSYFCLAALHGIAQANRATRIAAIRHDCQVAFEERYANSFRNSYCEFWRSFGAIERSRIAHEMPVPLTAPPISEVKAKHRKRALLRRTCWAEISLAAQQAIGSHVHVTESQTAPAGNRKADALAALQMQATALLVATLT
ncbi:hypothetical protein BH11PSE9_BH11PSE9_02940 [soil metagenome]